MKSLGRLETRASRHANPDTVLLATSAMILCAGLWFFPAPAAAETFAKGLESSNPVAAEALPKAQLHRGFLPASVDLSANMPPPGDQQTDGTCGAWATVYGAASYYARFQLHDPQLKLSPSYVFNQVEHDRKTCAGSNLIELLNFLRRRGVPTLEEYPTSMFCRADENSARANVVFRIPDAEVLAFAPYTKQGHRNVKIPFDVELMRQKLAEGHPIIVGMRTTGTLLDDLGAGDIYTARAAGDTSQPHGGHALVIVGYDNAKQAFKLMNSWGRHWGDNGFGWMSYVSAQSELFEAFAIMGDHPKPPAMSASRDTEMAPQMGDLACSKVELIKTGAGLVARGFAENTEDRTKLLAILQVIAEKLKLPGRAMANDIQVRPWPQCEALIALQEPLAASHRPRLRTLDGRTDLKVGDSFGFELVAPNFPSFLYLLYLQADGTAVNLLARRGEVREQIAPGAVLRLGDGSQPGPKFRASEPTGHESVIAIAARSPIAELEDLENSGGRYFRAKFDGKPSENAGAQDRRVLSAISDGLRTRPFANERPREIAADILFLTIGR